MARPWRIEFEGALYHVLSRGNDRRDIFSDAVDRFKFLEGIGEMADRFDVDVFAYVLMGNHYHLLLRTKHANLSKSMQWFGATYTRRFNNRHRRSGHLFQGRFKSILVQNDAYLLRLSYYIHRNPMRAGLVARLADYKWSSYRCYAYKVKAPGWLNLEPILSQFPNVSDRHRAYRQEAQKYAEEREEIWENLKHGFILGTEAFKEKMKKRHLPQMPHVEMPQQKKMFMDVDVEDLLSRSSGILGSDVKRLKSSTRLVGREALQRDMMIFLLWETGFFTNREIGDVFNLTYSAVSRRVAMLREKLKEDLILGSEYQRLKSLIKM
jgi:REP element-mobilizing transposase RayT